MQAKNILNEGHPYKSTESALNKVYQSVKSTLKNTVIPYNWIKKYKHQYQCLIESQADYILDNEHWWKELMMTLNFFILAMLLKKQCNLLIFDQLQSKGS